MTTLGIEDPQVVLAEVLAGLKLGTLVPYLGPGLVADPATPASTEALAAFFARKTTLPRRAVGNAWAAAQYVESSRFRATLDAWMAEAFAAPPVPTPFHRWLAGLGLPLIVDSWYSGEMRAALAETRADWAEVQGISRAHVGEDQWYRFYAPSGERLDPAAGERARTLLYAPHGGARPTGNFLISDADYVEVLTEIDIQSPIPEEVRRRRTGRSFVFVGCRFDDQMLRSYARQILKRSSERHYVIVDPATLTRNEQRFIDENDFVVLAMPTEQGVAALMG